MNNLFSQKSKTILVLALLIFSTSFFTLTAQSICNNGVGSHGKYTYEYWKDNGTGCMELGPDGTFSINWNNINNLLARTGVRPGTKDLNVTYGVDYRPNGNSYLCVYGWTRSPLVEYYIVESWGSWRPPGGEGFIGTHTSDGATYDIYRTTRVQQPSIDGTQTFDQYWAVRQSKRTSGTITVANHFNAWERNNMRMGNLYEVSFCVEGWQSNGTADVYSLDISSGPVTVTPTPTSGVVTPTPRPTTGDENLIIRASGSKGGEKITAEVNGTVVDSWTLQQGFQTLATKANGGIRINFTNDDEVSDGLDVQIDYIEYNGVVYQAEDQEVNTGTWQDDSCGGSYSEWLYCSGYIQFNTGTGTVTPTPTKPVVTPTPTPTGPVTPVGLVSFGSSAYTAVLNSPLNVNVFVNSGTQKVSAYGMDLTYSTSILSVNTAMGTQGVSAGTDGYISAAKDSSGTLTIGGFDAFGKGPGAKLHLITVHLTPKSKGNGTLRLTVNELIDDSYNNVGTPRGGSATVTVNDGSSVLLGDVDGNGVVNIVDALKIAQAYVGLDASPYNPAAADVDCNGTVNVVDALKVAQYYVGLLPSLSCN